MKAKIYFAILCICSGYTSVAQLSMPINKGQKPMSNIMGPSAPTLLQQKINSVKARLRNDSARSVYQSNLLNKVYDTSAGSGFDFPDRVFFALPKAQRDQVDAGVKSALDSYKEAALDQTVNQLNETSHWQAIVSGGVSNILRNSGGSPIGNFALGLQYRIGEFRKTSNSTIDPHYIYAAWSSSTTKSEDTGNILKTLIFPELNKSDFIVGWHRDVISGNITRSWVAEITLSTYKDTSGKKVFRSESLLGGYRIGFSGMLPGLNIPAGFQAFGYYNIINIDPKYNESYHTITNNIPTHNTFHCLGMRIQAEISGATLFFNSKYILNPQGEVTDPDLIRFVYTMGTLVSL